MTYNEKKYPMVWMRTSRRGYCFTANIPCRILEIRGKRVRIAALLVDGLERNHLVEERSLKHSPCHCFAECRALDKFKGKVVRQHAPGTGLARGGGTHKYLGCEAMERSGRLDDFFTSDCSYGCGCWMGGSQSGGPEGIDPFGACPKAPKEEARAG